MGSPGLKISYIYGNVNDISYTVISTYITCNEALLYDM